MLSTIISFNNNVSNRRYIKLLTYILYIINSIYLSYEIINDSNDIENMQFSVLCK